MTHVERTQHTQKTKNAKEGFKIKSCDAVSMPHRWNEHRVIRVDPFFARSPRMFFSKRGGGAWNRL
jgi:hypothetical protein